MSETKKIAVVTGANKGLGREAARQLANAGMHVAMCGRDLERIEEAAAALRDEGLSVEAFVCDVSDQESVDAFAETFADRHGRAHALVNNAGIMPDGMSAKVPTNPLEIPFDVIEQTMQTNVWGALRMARVVMPAMLEADYGRIVNVSSGLGQLSDMGGGFTSYRFSKTALNALTRMLHAHAQGKNVKTNSMCPGWVATDMGGKQAPRNVEDGADTMTWLATLPDDGPSGKFFRDRKPIPW